MGGREKRDSARPSLLLRDSSEDVEGAAALLARLRDFLPRMAAANEDLARLSPAALADASLDPQLEALSDGDESEGDEAGPAKKLKEEGAEEKELDSDDDEEAQAVQIDVALIKPESSQDPTSSQPLVQELPAEPK